MSHADHLELLVGNKIFDGLAAVGQAGLNATGGFVNGATFGLVNVPGSDCASLFYAAGVAGSFGVPGGGAKGAGKALQVVRRTEARNLVEQLAMAEAKSSPETGKTLQGVVMSDTKNNWTMEAGWVKKQKTEHGVTIHYAYNERTKEAADFKFKDPEGMK